MKLFFASAILLSCFCLNARAIVSQLAPNEMGVHIGGALGDGSSNVPLVSVTICEPGTNNCQTINRIELDTGSVGLRLFTSLTNKLNLPAVTAPNNQSIFECTAYGGGDSYWGAVHRADVKLGQVRATNVRIQTWQAVPNGVTCDVHSDQPAAGEINGIMGVSFAHDDCADVETDENCNVDDSFHYYSCDSTHCTPLNDATSLAVSNPILGLPRDNNGYVIEFPKVSAPQNSIDGWITFGLNTSDNNQMGATAAHEVPVPTGGWFQLKYQGQVYPSRFDTGAHTYYFPTDFGLAMCDYICPQRQTTMQLSLVTGDTVMPFNIEVSDPGDVTNNDDVQVIPGIANVAYGSGTFLIGMPFFYGKKVYFGLASDVKSTGFVAF